MLSFVTKRSVMKAILTLNAIFRDIKDNKVQ